MYDILVNHGIGNTDCGVLQETLNKSVQLKQTENKTMASENFNFYNTLESIIHFIVPISCNQKNWFVASYIQLFFCCCCCFLCNGQKVHFYSIREILCHWQVDLLTAWFWMFVRTVKSCMSSFIVHLKAFYFIIVLVNLLSTFSICYIEFVWSKALKKIDFAVFYRIMRG